MKFKVFFSILLLITIVLSNSIYNVIAYDPLGDIQTDISYNSKEYTVGGLNYSFYYSPNHSLIGVDELDLILEEANALSDILGNTNISVNSYILSGNELVNYKFITSVKDININGYTFTYFINKYAPNKARLLTEDPFTSDESDIIIKEILKGLFSSFYQIEDNVNSLDNLQSNLSSKLFLIKDNNTVNTEITNDLKTNVYNVFSLEFSNKINSHLQYYYQTKENLFGNKSEYLVLNFENIEGSYSSQVELVNTNYNTLVSIINGEYSTEEKNNLDTNMFGFDSDIDSVLIDAKNFSQTDYPNIFMSSQKSNLFSDLNNIRTEILNDLSNYKDYLINKRDSEVNSSSGTTNYTDGISSSGSILDFEYSNSGEGFDDTLVGSGLTDYENTTEDVLHNLEDYSNDSRDIVNKVNNYDTSLGVKVDSREDYGLALANNIERYTRLQNFLSGSTSLNDELFLNSVNLNILLKGDIKNEFININDGKTVRDVNIQSFSESYIDSNTTNFLLRKKLENYGKLMMNNQFLNKNIILPSTSKVNNDTLYKNYLKGGKGTYFNNYNKNSYVTVQERNDVEGFSGISFSYIPSPKQIKDTSDNQIGIELGSNMNYYLQDSNNGIEIDLEDGYNYDINIRTYNGNTSGITLNLLDSGDIPTPIVLKGDIVSKSAGRIKSKIVDSKNEDDSIKSLYVNDILAK